MSTQNSRTIVAKSSRCGRVIAGWCLMMAVLLAGTAQANTTYTWDNTYNAEWFSSSGGHWSPAWVNSSSSDAVVNDGHVYASSAGVTANSLTVGDGTGAAGSAEAKNSTDNAFRSITTITINSDGILTGGGNATTHLGLITLNGGQIGGGDNGGSAATYGVFNFDNTLHVTADSTISTGGGGVALSQTGGTQFNVDSGKTLFVTGIIVHKASASDYGLIKTGSGTMTLSGANTYTGGTVVTNGTLVLQNSYASTSFAVATNAVLEINVTGGQRDSAATTFSGAGSLIKTGGGEVIWGSAAATFALGAGSLIDVQAGGFTGGAWANENWENNHSDLNIGNGAVFSTVEANVRVNKITGSGTLGTGYSGDGYANLTIGIDGGSSTFSGVIQNTGNNPAFVGNLVKAGAGTIALTGNNTYSGSTAVIGGTLNFSGNNTIGAVTANGGNVLFSGGNSTISGNLSQTMDGGMAIMITNSVVTMNQLYSSANDMGSAGMVFTIGSGAEVHPTGGTYSRTWRGSGGMLLNGGVLYTPWLAANSTTHGNIVSGYGYIHFNGTAIVATQNESNFIQLAGGANYGNQNFARLNANTTFDTAGYDIGIGVVLDGAGGLVKAGAGTLKLSGACSYSGATMVTGGTLDLSTGRIYSGAGWANRSITVTNGGIVRVGSWSDADAGSEGGFGEINFRAENVVLDNGCIEYTGGASAGNSDRSFTIAAGGATLTASGSDTWQITDEKRGYGLASDGGTLTLSGEANGLISKVIPGTGGVVKVGAGTWTLTGTNSYTGATTVSRGTLLGSGVLASSVTVSNTAVLGAIGDFTVSNATLEAGAVLLLEDSERDRLNVAGNLVTASTGGTNFVRVVFFNPGVYPIIRYGPAGIGGGGFDAFVLSLLNGAVGVLSNNVDDRTVYLVVDHGAEPITWTAGADNKWDINTTANWATGAVATVYQDGDMVLFDDTSANQVVNIKTVVSPVSMTFSNLTRNYSFSGSAISGGTGFMKYGGGILTFNNTNAFTGPIVINEGEVRMGAAGALGNNSGITINGGVLEVVETLGGSSGDYNWYLGVDSTEIKTGGSLTINSHSHIHNLTLSGGELASSGVDPYHDYGSWALDDSTTVNGGVTSTISAQQVSANDGGFSVDSGSALDITGTIAAGRIVKSGAGTMALSGANTYSGETTVTNGILLVNNTAGSGTGTGMVIATNNGTLGGTGTITGLVTACVGGAVRAGGTNGSGTLTFQQGVSFTNNGKFVVTLNEDTCGLLRTTGGNVNISSSQLVVNMGPHYTGSDFPLWIINNEDDNSTVNGTFEGLPEGASILVGRLEFIIHYGAAYGTTQMSGGNDVVLIQVTPCGTILIVR